MGGCRGSEKGRACSKSHSWGASVDLLTPSPRGLSTHQGGGKRDLKEIRGNLQKSSVYCSSFSFLHSNEKLLYVKIYHYIQNRRN